jgi:hypothetical protein
MHIDEIRDCICEYLGSIDGYSLWDDLLQETNPANYGYEVGSVLVQRNDIWVDVPNRTFTFKNLHLSFSARMAGTKGGYDQGFQFKLSGSGSFEFGEGSQGIRVAHIDLDEGQDLELYGESNSRVE